MSAKRKKASKPAKPSKVVKIARVEYEVWHSAHTRAVKIARVEDEAWHSAHTTYYPLSPTRETFAVREEVEGQYYNTFCGFSHQRPRP